MAELWQGLIHLVHASLTDSEAARLQLAPDAASVTALQAAMPILYGRYVR